jgi:hypothetical protein
MNCPLLSERRGSLINAFPGFLTMKAASFSLIALTLLTLAGCGGAESDIIGTWSGSQGTLVITKDKWVVSSGPMTINLEYKVEKTEGNVIEVGIFEPGKPTEKETVKITVADSSTLKMSDGGMFAGTYKRQ